MDAEDTTTTTTPAPVEGGPVVEPTTLAPNPPAAVQGVGVEAEPERLAAIHDAADRSESGA